MCHNIVRCVLLFLTISSLTLTSTVSTAADFGSVNEVIGAGDSDRSPNELIESLSDWNQRQLLAIKRSALEKRWLLTPILVQSLPTPLGTALGAKIVFFSLKGPKLILMEDSTGKVIASEFAQSPILAEFKPERIDDERIVFDFDMGMKTLYYTTQVFFSDEEENESHVYSRSTQVFNSYIDGIESDGESTRIKHVVQIATATPDNQEVRETNRVDYTFSPYNTSKDFVPKESTMSNKVGFFEITPLLEPRSGRTTIYATRWDKKKFPVTIHIDSNTPAPFLPAINAGIAYWNSVGRAVIAKDVFLVKSLPKQADRLDPTLNIIHWIDWRNAGFALADFINDPITGEIIKGQVFLTSAFAVNARERAKSMFSQLDSLKVHHGESSKMAQAGAYPRILLRKFPSEHYCTFNPVHEFKSFLETSLSDQWSDKKILTITLHYLASTVAHELGHILGLRHNFAGSLAGNIPDDRHPAIYETYLKDLQIPSNVLPANSVMDYPVFADDVMIGSSIMSSPENIFSYDKTAFAWAYTEAPLADIPNQLFCTDMEAYTSNTADCSSSDSGQQPFTRLVDRAKVFLESRPYSLAARLIAALSPSDPRDKKNIREIDLDFVRNEAAAYAQLIYDTFALYLNTKAEFLSVRNEIPNLRLHSIDDRTRSAYLAHQKKLIKNVSSYKKLFAALFPDLQNTSGFTIATLTSMKGKFTTLTKKDELKNLLDSADLDYVNRFADTYFTMLNEYLIRYTLLALQGINPQIVEAKERKEENLGEMYGNSEFVYADVYTKELQNELYSLVERVILSEQTREIVKTVKKEGQKAKIVVNLPTYLPTTRRIAINLLNNRGLFQDAHFHGPTFDQFFKKIGFALNRNTQKVLQVQVEAGASSPLVAIESDPFSLTGNLREYLSIEKEILGLAQIGEILPIERIIEEL